MHWRKHHEPLDRWEAYEMKCDLPFCRSAERLVNRLKSR